MYLLRLQCLIWIARGDSLLATRSSRSCRARPSERGALSHLVARGSFAADQARLALLVLLALRVKATGSAWSRPLCREPRLANACAAALPWAFLR